MSGERKHKSIFSANGESEGSDSKESHEETVQGHIRPKPEWEQLPWPTVAFPFGDVFDPEGLDGQGLVAILNDGTPRLVFHRCPRTPRDPGLKTSSCSLRRHDPDQVPRVSPSRGRLSALLGSPLLPMDLRIIKFPSWPGIPHKLIFASRDICEARRDKGNDHAAARCLFKMRRERDSSISSRTARVASRKSVFIFSLGVPDGIHVRGMRVRRTVRRELGQAHRSRTLSEREYTQIKPPRGVSARPRDTRRRPLRPPRRP